VQPGFKVDHDWTSGFEQGGRIRCELQNVELSLGCLEEVAKVAFLDIHNLLGRLPH
jgi:hypothetical protein